MTTITNYHLNQWHYFCIHYIYEVILYSLNGYLERYGLFMDNYSEKNCKSESIASTLGIFSKKRNTINNKSRNSNN